MTQRNDLDTGWHGDLGIGWHCAVTLAVENTVQCPLASRTRTNNKNNKTSNIKKSSFAVFSGVPSRFHQRCAFAVSVGGVGGFVRCATVDVNPYLS